MVQLLGAYVECEHLPFVHIFPWVPCENSGILSLSIEDNLRKEKIPSKTKSRFLSVVSNPFVFYNFFVGKITSQLKKRGYKLAKSVFDCRCNLFESLHFSMTAWLNTIDALKWDGYWMGCFFLSSLRVSSVYWPSYAKGTIDRIAPWCTDSNPLNMVLCQFANSASLRQ